MPLFGQKRHSNDRKKSGGNLISQPIPIRNGAQQNGAGTTAAAPTLPPPPPVPNNAAVTKPHPQSMLPSRKELLFHCQLAHGSATLQIKDFSNVKELYQKIVEAFGLNQDDVRMCVYMCIHVYVCVCVCE